MNNSQLIEKLTNSLTSSIQLIMELNDLGYEAAKEIAKEESVAGVAVWAKVDAIFCGK